MVHCDGCCPPNNPAALWPDSHAARSCNNLLLAMHGSKQVGSKAFVSAAAALACPNTGMDGNTHFPLQVLLRPVCPCLSGPCRPRGSCFFRVYATPLLQKQIPTRKGHAIVSHVHVQIVRMYPSLNHTPLRCARRKGIKATCWLTSQLRAAWIVDQWPHLKPGSAVTIRHDTQ
mmetsp:Transcript_144619/g.462338  ORF Transcript_144619/g.462338 Transcript_144619/m.462338 type:complete len:173 (+) Transcript_144619:450-968(+)